MALGRVLAANRQRPLFAGVIGEAVRLKNVLRLLLLVASLFQTNGDPSGNKCICGSTKCQPVDCPPSVRSVDACTCCPVCLKPEGARCGGEYASSGTCQRWLHCNLRRPGSIFGTKGSKIGVCEPNTCMRWWCPFRQRCLLNRTSRSPQCSCQHFRCAGKFAPVCGHNNREYLSACFLQREECLTGSFIGIQHTGPCRPTATLTNMLDTNSIPDTSEPSGVCVYQNNYYRVGQKIDSASDPCIVMYCTAADVIKVTTLPGCRGNPPERDYHVDKLTVSGGWTSWSEWTPCLGSCGSGARSRNRTCTNPAPRYEGRLCGGLDYQEEECQPDHCQSKSICDKYVSPWSYWSPCSAWCGRGLRRRGREHLSSIHEVASVRDVLRQCPYTQTEPCSVVPCPAEQEFCTTDVCRNHTTYDYLWRTHPDHPAIIVGKQNLNCRSLQKHHLLVCGGSFPSPATASPGNQTCCVPAQVRTESVVFQCNPAVGRQRLIPIDFPSYCQCKPCDGDGGGGS